MSRRAIYLYRYTHIEDSPYMMIRLWLCLGLGLIAVFFHEIRPYKVCALQRDACNTQTQGIAMMLLREISVEYRMHWKFVLLGYEGVVWRPLIHLNHLAQVDHESVS